MKRAIVCGVSGQDVAYVARFLITRFAIDNSLLRPTDLAVGRGNPRKAEEIIGGKAKYKMTDVVRMMSAPKA